MIKFLRKVKPLWVSCAISDFDGTEVADYPREERAKIKFKINPLFPGKARKIREENTETVLLEDFAKIITEHEAIKANPQSEQLIKDILMRGGIATREVFNNDGYNKDCIDVSIDDWEGLIEPGDIIKFIPCTRENKVLLFIDGGYTNMGLRIINIAADLAARYDKLIEEEKTVQEKNLPTSQDGVQKERTK